MNPDLQEAISLAEKPEEKLKKKEGKKREKGLKFERKFIPLGSNPFDDVEWEVRDAFINNEKGEKVFEQKGVEIPSFWSQQATNIVVQKYFRGRLGTLQRETSVRQLVGRVAKTISGWGRNDGYFATPEDADTFEAELTHLLLHQKMAFNSPVWFNVGIEGPKPQSSACFILSVQDDIKSIMDVASTEVMVFKYGSGTGMNMSTLRSSKEYLTGGGRSSGPVTFMKGFDAFNGVIKAGGKTRRAAKMVILNADHPDIVEFINCKAKEEKKAHVLIDNGFDPKLDGDVYGNLFFQNANHTVRVTDEFMKSVEEGKEWQTRFVKTGEVADTYEAKELIKQISDATWFCGDPGLQFDTTINKWHTCPNSGRINASNPCAEFMFIDDSSCNLASLNLMKFRKENGELDVGAFKHAVEITITAQEIIVDNASYPTEIITRNTSDFRPLGLGYANLGALLMANGLPYDSDEGRNYAAAITALMTGWAYRQSAVIAKEKGVFKHYRKNEKPFIGVMNMHRANAYMINHRGVQPELLEAARNSWDEALYLGTAHGYRNANATVLAPTGTISFLMDCDTTGVEPDIALVKYKWLLGGGMLKMVNQTVPEALKKLGYKEKEMGEILSYIEKNDTIEGAPLLREEHLPVFDCAFKPKNGKRFIQYMGHINMMAAIQPFISGAISKCVTGDTIITTEKGLIPIGRLYGREKADSFRQLDIQVASSNDSKLATHFYYGGKRRVMHLRLANGRTISGTPNHMVKAISNGRYFWKRLDELLPGDAVAFRIGTEMWALEDANLSSFKPSALYGYQKRIKIPERMTPKLSRLLGYYIAEGNKTRSNWTICITNNNDIVLKECVDLFHKIFELKATIEIDKRNGVKSARVSSKTLFEFLDYVGCDGLAAEKQLPWAVLESTRKCVIEFISGLWLDGYVTKTNVVAITLASRKLLQQLQIVFDNLGIWSQLGAKYNKEYNRDYYCLTINGNSAKLFAKLFEMREEAKAQRLIQVLAKVKRVNAVYSDIIPAFKGEMQQLIREQHDTMEWRTIFDHRTTNLSHNTVKRFLNSYSHPELEEIVGNNIHFASVEDIGEAEEEVFDIYVPEGNAFIGNSIINHNTVNMPNEVTPDEISQAYTEAWRKGLKAIAIYRDGCKRSQPLTTSIGGKKEEVVLGPIRRRLLDERQAITHKFSINNVKGYITVGLYEDGQPGELFISIAKEGSTLSGLLGSFARMVSFSLQYGIPLKFLISKFVNTRFEPMGVTDNRDIRFAKSITDYLFRWLALKFLTKEDLEELGILAAGDIITPIENGNENDHQTRLNIPVLETREVNPLQVVDARQPNSKITFSPQLDAPACHSCGALMVRNGNCYKCINCGATSGCS